MPIVEAVANMHSHGVLGPGDTVADALMAADEQAVRDCIAENMSLTEDAEKIKERKAAYRAKVLEQIGG